MEKAKQRNDNPQVMTVDEFDDAYMEELEKKWQNMSGDTAKAIARNFGAPDAKYDEDK